MRFVSTRGGAAAVSLHTALVEGLAPDGGLYVPERIEPWDVDDVAQLGSWSLPEVGARVLRPFAAGEIDEATLAALVRDALNFRIRVVEIEPGIFALELFHGPTLAFKDVGARVMARLMGAMGEDVTVLVATSGDTGSAVANAFHGVPHVTVVILYPDQRVSPTQEAQLTMFNAERSSNVRGYAVAGTFDDCQRLVKAAFGDPEIKRAVRLTSANSINVGRLLPQMIYYFYALSEVSGRPVVCVPSGNFGNLTAGLMAKRAGAPIGRFVAATNANDVVPAYLATGRFEPRRSIQTIANAMDVGNPSNFERLLWLYDNDLAAVRRDVVGSRFRDEEVRTTIRDVYERRGYLLDPHSAIGYMGIKEQVGRASRTDDIVRDEEAGVFLATAHPAKFPEIVEPIIGREIPKPPALAEALARPKKILRIEATVDAVRARVTAPGDGR